MIVYDLVCDGAHRFEAWFGSSSDYDDQQQRGLLECPVCSSAQVAKAVMAPAVPAKSNQKGGSLSIANDDPMARLLMLQRAFEASSDYVGDRFAAEARAIHDAGETRSIHGEATPDEVKALREDGIQLLPLPFRPRARSDA
ncbi:DUF1178 family protein [Sandarakinorhabdus sp.]|jgi:hypothetical protein|uniref:DUF1178 family protein n=1 Tax=Sandarakinorhabdus sp. TaxID=1916663 RepID=UPI0028AE5016|nr:DUF1178 family protein [Sandarakinorhabdus sp.]